MIRSGSRPPGRRRLTGGREPWRACRAFGPGPRRIVDWPGEPLRSTKREGAVVEPQVEIEAQGSAREGLEGVHVERHVLDNLLKNASPLHPLAGLRSFRNGRPTNYFFACFLVQHSPHLIAESAPEVHAQLDPRKRRSQCLAARCWKESAGPRGPAALLYGPDTDAGCRGWNSTAPSSGHETKVGIRFAAGSIEAVQRLGRGFAQPHARQQHGFLDGNQAVPFADCDCINVEA